MRIQTKISGEEIERFLDNIRPRLREKKDGFYDFILDPAFDVSQKEDEFLFQSHWIDYRVSTRALDETNIRSAYYTFANALCKLNIYMNPGLVTPFARLETNYRFEKDSRFPEKIVVDVYPKGKFFFAKVIQFQNEYKIALRLSEKDRNRIVRAIHFSAQFPEINFRSYYDRSNSR